MADANFTLSSKEESRSGARACMEVLLAIESIANGPMRRLENGDIDHSMKTYWEMQEAYVAEMHRLQIAGKHSEFITGFVSVFAEYAGFVNEGAGHPNLHKWKPEASMTEEEKKIHRAQFEKRVEEANA